MSQAGGGSGSKSTDHPQKDKHHWVVNTPCFMGPNLGLVL